MFKPIGEMSYDEKVQEIKDLESLMSLSRHTNVNSILNGAIDNNLLKKYNIGIAANGSLYSNEVQGFMPALMKFFFNKRKEYKKMMLNAKKGKEETGDKELDNDIAAYDNIQQALKILINSAYGAFGNEWFIFYSTNNAEAVTTGGQLTIRWVEKYLNNYLNELLGTNNIDYVVAIDTDSVYLNLSAYVNAAGVNDKNEILAFLDGFCAGELQKVIDQCFEDLANKLNAYEQAMEMKREVIADKAFWRAKKMYAMNVLDNEGVRYHEPQIKIMGLEAIRSSVPELSRKAIKEAIRIILNEDNEALISYIRKFREEFETMPFESVAFPRGVNGLNKYYDSKTLYSKGTPMHVKGALIYNDLLKKRGLTDKYPMIYNGDKIKFAYLKELNPVFEGVIAASGPLPKELDMDRYIDRNMQFEKTFLNPIKSITDVIGWETEKRFTIEDFF